MFEKCSYLMLDGWKLIRCIHAYVECSFAIDVCLKASIFLTSRRLYLLRYYWVFHNVSLDNRIR